MSDQYKDIVRTAEGAIYTSKTGKRYLMRDARLEDFHEIYEIWREGMEQHGYQIEPEKKERYAAHLRHLIRAQGEVYRFWVAEAESGEIVGWQSLMPYGNNPFSRELSGESSTYVRRTMQARGVAHILLFHVIAHAKTTPLHHVVAFVAEDNHAVDEIGRQLGGWQRIGVIPSSAKPPRRPGMAVYINLLG